MSLAIHHPLDLSRISFCECPPHPEGSLVRLALTSWIVRVISRASRNRSTAQTAMNTVRRGNADAAIGAAGDPAVIEGTVHTVPCTAITVLFVFRFSGGRAKLFARHLCRMICRMR